MKEVKKNVSLILLAGIFGAALLLLMFFYFKTNRSTHEIFYQITSSLRSKVVLYTSIIKLFELLPVIIIFVYLISFSLLFTLGKFQEVSFHFSELATPSYIILLVFLAVNIFLQFITIPNLHQKICINRYYAKISYKAFNEAQELKKQRKYDEALDAINIIFEFESSNKKALSLYDKINKERSAAIMENKLKQPSSKKELIISPPKDFFERGKIEYQKRNYYAALFYLERALTLHKNNKELQDLYNRCLIKVRKALGALTEKQIEMKKLIQQKERGLNYLNQKNYYKAYRIFRYLHKKYPKLEDIELYLKTSEAELQKIDFLPQELKKYEWLPGWNNVIFFDKDGYLNIVNKIILFKNNYYFFDIKRYKITTKITKVLNVKYGKWINNGIRLKNKNDYYEIKQKDLKKYIIRPFVNPWYIANSSNIISLQDQLNAYNVFALSESLKKSGFDIQSKFQWIATKLGIFFAIYVLSMLISGFGWSKRSIYEFPPLFKLLLFLIVSPIISYYLYIIFLDFNHILMYTFKYFHRFIIKSSHFNIFIYVLLIQSIISIISTVYFLSQKNE